VNKNRILTIGLGAFSFLANPGTLIGHFVNSTEASKIEYIHSIEAEVPTTEELGLDRETVRLISLQAGGAATDVNNDGWTDYIGARYNLSPLLYINNRDGTFTEDGAARGMGLVVDASGIASGDLDNDGDQDLFITPHYGNRYFLLINDGSGNFTEEAVERGADMTTALEPHEGYSVGLVDYDLDGFLDVYVSEWGPKEPSEFELHSVLLRNLGNKNPGHFENTTVEAGLLQPAGESSSQNGFSSAWADFDGDGWPDLYLIADFFSSQMYWNNGDGTFTEGTDASGLGKEEFGMGVAVTDFDNDGDLDIYATSIFDQFLFDEQGSNHGNKLYENLGNRNFAEISIPAGAARTGWGWGASFFEFDNDGDVDLMVTNGSDAAAWAIGSEGDFPNLDAVDDQTYMLLNDGSGVFQNVSSAVGVKDKDYGKAVIVLDYNKDGDQDIIITNTFGSPIVYESNASENGNDWVRFELEGTVSNRDGIGALISVLDSGTTQTSVYNPTNAFMGQREAFTHFGFGDSDGIVDLVTIKWPSGFVQELDNLSMNTVHSLTEPETAFSAPVYSTDLVGAALEFGDRLELKVDTISAPQAIYIWERNGVPIDGANGPVYIQKRFQPIDIGSYRVKAINPNGETYSVEVEVTSISSLEGKSVARLWNEFMLEAIRKDFPDPTVHSRNLYHVSAAIWDAFWAYEFGVWESVRPVFKMENTQAETLGEQRVASQSEAISHAAYRVLTHRYRNSPGKERSLFGFRWLMLQLGYDPDNEERIGSTAAAVGNRIGFSVIEQALLDGANEANGYADTSGYIAKNDPLVFDLSGTELSDPNAWQPLAFDYLVTQNGIPIGKSIQTFLGVNWREVSTFALPKPTSNTIAFDPGPPPNLGTATENEFLDAAVEVIRFSSYLDPSSNEMIDISPGALLNNTLGFNDGTGRTLNPVTEEPYPANLVRHADYGRVLAEFWADGPSSETPPGHWNALHNEITDHTLFERRYGGAGRELSALEWDVRAYLALNGAMHDAAVAAWTLKRQYDYIRPVSIIRYLGGLGQSTDTNAPSYHPQGLPLANGLIEVVTAASSANDERHNHLADHVGKIAIRAWTGEPNDHETGVGGVDWILANDWMPYQRSTFVTPAFAAYVSGHSTFSRAAAEVMTLLTGSPFFPGGLGEFHFEGGKYLEFEYGPSENFTLQWATYYDAADQAGLSRLYGGIHVEADDIVGRALGARVGVEAFVKANTLSGNSDAPSPITYIENQQSMDTLSHASFTKLRFSESRNVGLPIRRVDDGSSLETTPGVFISQSGSSLLTRIVGDELDGFESSGYIAGNDYPFLLDFTLSDDDLTTILIQAYPASQTMYPNLTPLADPTMALYRLDNEGNETLIAKNDNWSDDDRSSLTELFVLRENFQNTIANSAEAAALVRTLEGGRYRIRVEGKEGASGLSAIELNVVSN